MMYDVVSRSYCGTSGLRGVTRMFVWCLQVLESKEKEMRSLNEELASCQVDSELLAELRRTKTNLQQQLDTLTSESHSINVCTEYTTTIPLPLPRRRS